MDPAAPIVDTDILIDYLRGRGPGSALLEHLGHDGYLLTAISAFELALGTSHRANPAPVAALLHTPSLALTPRAGLRGGEVLADLRRRGTGIDIRDALQAGICLDAERPLVTRNRRHFDRVPGLSVVSPDSWG